MIDGIALGTGTIGGSYSNHFDIFDPFHALIILIMETEIKKPAPSVLECILPQGTVQRKFQDKTPGINQFMHEPRQCVDLEAFMKVAVIPAWSP